MIAPVQFFKCLSDETRLKCTLLVHSEGKLCVCELMAALDDSQPKISRHLAQLRNCGILVDERQGQWVFYSINPALPDWTRRILDEGCGADCTSLATSQKKLRAMKSRPICC